MNIYGIIYKITNKVNGKTYIGQTIHNFDKRYSGSIENTNNKHLKRSIDKYGIENFEVNKQIDVAFSREELNIKEKCWIAIYDSFNNGYNMTTGGEGTSGLNAFANKTEEEMKIIGKKISEANKGKHRTNEAKRKMSKARKGKHLSEEHKRKINESRKGNKNAFLGKHHTEETKKKMSELLKGEKNPMYGKPSPKRKKVICITTGKIFNSIKDAEKYYNVAYQSISCCCKKKLYSAGKLQDGTKLQWKYLEDYNNEYKGILINPIE